MANCVKCRFSLNLQLFPVVLKSAPVKYMATYCPWDLHQILSECTSMSLWWQNNPSLWLLWTVSIPKWVSIRWHAAYAPSDAKLLEGGVYLSSVNFESKYIYSNSVKCIKISFTKWGPCSLHVLRLAKSDYHSLNGLPSDNQPVYHNESQNQTLAVITLTNRQSNVWSSSFDLVSWCIYKYPMSSGMILFILNCDEEWWNIAYQSLITHAIVTTQTIY